MASTPVRLRPASRCARRPAISGRGGEVHRSDLRLADMDRQGVATHALSLTTPMTLLADARAVAQAWRPLGTTAPRGAPGASRSFRRRWRLCRCTIPTAPSTSSTGPGKLPGMRGVYMGTNIESRDLDDPLFEPIFARIEELGLPVFLHPLQVVGGSAWRSSICRTCSAFPFDTAIAACHLIFGGVLDRHPKLQFSLPHGGGVLIADRPHRPRRDACAGNQVRLPRPPSKYLQRFTYDTVVALEADHGVSDSRGGGRAHHARQRLLLRHGLRAPAAVRRRARSVS